MDIQVDVPEGGDVNVAAAEQHISNIFGLTGSRRNSRQLWASLRGSCGFPYLRFIFTLAALYLTFESAYVTHTEPYLPTSLPLQNMQSDRVPSLEAIKAQLERDLISPAHALAGAGGGAISLGLTYPLYTIVTKLQVRSNYGGPIDTFLHVLREEGWTSLYAGLAPALIGNAYAQGVYYYWYALFRSIAEGKGVQKRPVGTLASLFIGALAGAITVVFTNPFWVVTTRLQTSRETTKKDDELFRSRPKQKGVMQTIHEIYAEGGIKAFWNGLIPSLILVINPALQYMVFEQIKSVWEKRNPKGQLTSAHFFLLGAIAKTVATVITYPYITVKTRLQAKGKYSGTLDVLQKIYTQEGLASFFKGMESKIVQSVLTAAFLFMVQNKLASFFLRLLVWFYIRRNPVALQRK